VRRTAFDEVGGFDESQWMYAEDLDLGWRLRRAGWKTVYEPDATVFHEDRAASKRAFGDQVVARHMEASYAWMERRRGVVLTRVYALLNMLGALLQLATRKPEGRRRARYWLRIHRLGMKSPAAPSPRS
jgi:N-acetylglucosaminyl-diphospho-decaprenol L-rhamnosyltransferase